MKNKSLLSSAVLLLAAMIWGFAFVAQNALADTVPPFTVNAVRSLIASAVLMPAAMIIRRMNGKTPIEKSSADRKKLIKAGLICGTMLCISANLQQFGIAMYPDGAPVEAHSGFLTAMYILFVPLFGLFLGKKPSPLVLIGVGIAVVGLYLLCLSDGLGALYAGDIVVLICGVCYAVQILCVDHFIAEVDPVKLSSVQFFVCGVLSAILMLIFEKPDWSAVLAGWQPMLFLALMSSGVAYTLQIVGQKYASSPTLASILMSMESVFALIGGAIFMGVLPKPVELLGCAVMLAAIIIAQLPPGLFKRKQA
jgi:drug/metabolite transporter (DMT)-like permease